MSLLRVTTLHNLIAGVVAVGGLGGCSTGGAPTVGSGIDAVDGDNSTSARIEADRASVVVAAMRFFTSRNIVVDTASIETGHVQVSALGAEMASAADCGERMASFPVDGEARVSVAVLDGDGGADVTIATEFTQVRQFGTYPMFRIACRSTGVIEKALIEALHAEAQPKS